MKKLLALFAALLFAVSAQAQTLPSPTFNNVTVAGAFFVNNCSGVLIANGPAAATCETTLDMSFIPIGTSGAAIPLMTNINTWTAKQIFPDLTFTGHLYGQAETTTLTACGTSPTLSTGANDTHGTVTTGTGSFTSCQINFATAYLNVPDCITKPALAGTSQWSSTATTTNLVVSYNGSGMASTKFTYICMGQ